MAAKQLEWEAHGRRFVPRVMAAGRVSGVETEDRKMLDSDLTDIRCAIEFVAERRALKWDTLFTDVEIPVPDLPQGASPDERRHARAAVLAKNISATEHSDCLILHAWNNGSAMLGEIQRAFLSGPFARPVIVLRVRGSRRFSLAWEALADDFPQLTVIEFGSNLAKDLTPHLESVADLIEQSAQARAGINSQWAPVCRALDKALASESPEVRRRVAADMGRSVGALYGLVRTPMRVASLPQQQFNRLIERYGDQIRRAVLLDQADRTLARPELDAWRAWRRDTQLDRATSALEIEVKAREMAGIYKSRPQRRTAQSWEMLARDHGL